MKYFTTKFRSLCCKEEGVTAIEYALIASLIAVIIVGSVSAVGDQVLALYQSVADALP
jgi:pilus assembly protein Flp/PilA